MLTQKGVLFSSRERAIVLIVAPLLFVAAVMSLVTRFNRDAMLFMTIASFGLGVVMLRALLRYNRNAKRHGLNS
jgi:hypothetical protein